MPRSLVRSLRVAFALVCGSAFLPPRSLYGCVVVSAGAMSGTSTTPPNSASPVPPFVAHVDDALLQEAWELAKARHERAVQAALDSYPTRLPVVDDDNDDSEEGSSRTSSSFDAASVSLRSHGIHAPGTIPDFGDVIPRRVMVTDPPLLSTDECRRVVRHAEEHFGNSWPTQRSGEYDVAGCWIKDVPVVKEWFLKTVQHRLFPLLAAAFPDFVDTPDDLCVDQTYLFRYTSETGGRTGVHTDAGCLSFTIALNDDSEYEGGGTWFEGLQQHEDNGGGGGGGGGITQKNVLEMRCGQVAIRPGGVKHAGHAVHSGVRYVIGGFCMNRHKPEPVRMLLTPGNPHELASSGSQQLRALEAAVALNPNFFGSYTLLANEHKRLGNFHKAQQVLEYCLEHVHPLAGEAAYSLGMMYLDQGRSAEAEQCFETCLKDDPQDTEAMMALAQLCNLRGDAAGEEAHYHRVLETPGTQPRVRASAYCNLGVLHEGEDDEIEYYRRALELRPDGFQARFSLASALASREEWPEAVEHFRLALENPDAPAEHSGPALELLYRASVMQMHTSAEESPPRTQEEVVERIQRIMGADHYAELESRRSNAHR